MPEWVRIAVFSTGLEADVARATLEEVEIPVLVRGNQVGAFGGGFQGPVVGGVELYVPSEAAERARELVSPDDDQ